MTDSRFKGRTFKDKKVKKIGGDRVGKVVESKWLKRAKRRARHGGEGWFNENLDDVLAVEWEDNGIAWIDKGKLTLADD